MRKFDKGNLLFLVVLLLYVVYAAIYIYKTSFVVSGQRYFVLFDDAMISMRYARNFAQGYGLVWNPGGAQVEGYTNPLWVVFMSFFHLFPIPASKISLFIQVSGGIFIIASLVYIKKIARLLSGSWVVALLAVTLTAFYTPLNNWALQGMEVSVLVVILIAALWLVLANLKSGGFSPWPYLLLGVGTLVRIDMAVPYIIILAFLALADPGHRRGHLAWGLGVLAFFLLGQTLFRLWYYGDILPNTYYLKVAGYPFQLRITHGLYVLFRFILGMNWALFLFPFLSLAFRRDRSIVLLFLVLLGQLAYSVYVGGDAWEHKGGSNRYIALAMPVFFILFADTAWLLLNAVIERLTAQPSRASLALGSLGMVLFVLASMVNMNYLVNIRSLERWALLRQPDFIEGNKEYVQISLALEKITRPDASIAVVSAGAIPYFTDLHAIDLLGKNDPVIAHEKAHLRSGPFNLENFRPGHMKWDYDYSIGQLKPDAVVQLWGDTETAEAYIKQYYVVGGAEGDLSFSLRKGSENILWDKVVLVP